MWRSLVEIQAFVTLGIVLMLAGAAVVRDGCFAAYLNRYTSRYAPERSIGTRASIFYGAAVVVLAIVGVILLVRYKDMPVVLSVVLMAAVCALITKIHKWQALLVSVSSLEVLTVMPGKSVPLAVMALQAICVELLAELAKRYGETIRIVSSITLWMSVLIAGVIVDTLAIAVWPHSQLTGWWRQIPQAYNIGLLTPLVGCMFFAAIAMWAERLSSNILRIAPQIGALCGVAVGLALTTALHWRFGNAALVGGGAITGFVTALIMTREYRCSSILRYIARQMS